jgi:hypothetical protein
LSITGLFHKITHLVFRFFFRERMHTEIPKSVFVFYLTSALVSRYWSSRSRTRSSVSSFRCVSRPRTCVCVCVCVRACHELALPCHPCAASAALAHVCVCVCACACVCVCVRHPRVILIKKSFFCMTHPPFLLSARQPLSGLFLSIWSLSLYLVSFSLSGLFLSPPRPHTSSCSPS